MEVYDSIFDYIVRQEALYKMAVSVNGKQWRMKDHIERSALYRDSDIMGTKTDLTPIKNITRPILNLQYRTEDIDVKDVQIYVDDKDKYHLSFLVKKYHDDVYSQEYDLDTFFDQLNQSRVDFGGGLSKDLGTECPEVVPMQSIAFCDQTDILSGPIGLKHSYSPDQLLDMQSRGWGSTANGATISLEDLIRLSKDEKKEQTEGMVNQTPGRYIEIYEVHGNLPKVFADPMDESGLYETRIYICAFYQKKGSSDKTGVILYTAKETESPFKLILRDPIYGRALGFGGAEELFESQTWVNYDMIRLQNLLDSASKTILGATGPNSKAIANKNSLDNMENNQILDLGDSDLKQIDTFPRNSQLFEKSVQQWEAHAQMMGAANDSIMGESPASGTPFRLQELVTRESHGLHDYRRGKFAKHLEQIYKDWIIPQIEKKICEGMTFLSELSLEEMQYVTDCVVRNQSNEYVFNSLVSGVIPTPQDIEAYKQKVRDELKRRGNKHFIEILKGEFKGAKLSVKVNIAGKQKDLVGKVDKLTNVFRTIIANPYILQSPPIAQLFNAIIEASGLDPVDLSNFNVPPLPMRRMTETIDYKDLQPQDQKAMLTLAGIDTSQSELTPYGTQAGK